MNIEKRKIKDLKANPKNPRIMKQRAIDAVAKSIKTFGYCVPIVIDEKNMILAGHTRLKALQQEQVQEVEVVVLKGLTEDQKKTFNIMDNKVNEINEWDDDRLAELVKGIETELMQYGFIPEEINKMFETTNKEKDEDATPLVADTRVVNGDKWQLGDHILVCGDSLQPETYKQLLGKDRPELMFTDPPYNVNYKSSSISDKSLLGRKTLENDNQTDQDFDTFLKNFWTSVLPRLSDTASIYMCYSPHNAMPFLELVKDMPYSSTIIWAKSSIGQLGDGRYRHTYESLLYTLKDKENAKWNLKTNESDVWYIEKDGVCACFENNMTTLKIHTTQNTYEVRFEGKIPGNIRFLEKDQDSDFWIEKRDNVASYVHPTQKPVKLIERAIHNSSDVGAQVIDPFGGSGSTLIACEKTKRKARIIELDPIFCDVIMARWESYTKNKAVKI